MVGEFSELTVIDSPIESIFSTLSVIEGNVMKMSEREWTTLQGIEGGQPFLKSIKTCQEISVA